MNSLLRNTRETGLGVECRPTSNVANIVKKPLQFLLLTGWLIPVGIALIFFGRWIVEIVVHTLKGGNFDQLYDLHQVRDLDTTLVCSVIAFIWATLAVCRWARKQVSAS